MWVASSSTRSQRGFARGAAVRVRLGVRAVPRRGIAQRRVKQRGRRLSMVLRHYQDCRLSCCKEGKCPELKYSYFDAEQGQVHATGVRVGATGAQTRALTTTARSTWRSTPAKEAATLAPTAAKPSGVTVTKETTQMPTYGAALLSIFLIGLVGTVCGTYLSVPAGAAGARVQVGAVRRRGKG